MMEKLVARGEEVARHAEGSQASRVANELRELVGAAAVSVENKRVLVRGSRILQRWLADPALRFFGRGLK